MKTKKKKKKEWRNFEFTDYSGIKVMTNNQAAKDIFGTVNPSPLLINCIKLIVSDPDFVFTEDICVQYKFYYSKQINGYNFVLATSTGYGFIDGKLDIEKRAIHSLSASEVNSKHEASYYSPMKIIYHGKNVQGSS